MLDVLSWWVCLEMIGWAAWPVAYRFFRFLPGRGFPFVKPLGLLLIGYPYWLLGTLGFLNNTRGAVALTVVLMAGLCWWFYGRGSTHAETRDERDHAEKDQAPLAPDQVGERVAESPLGWIRRNWTLVLATELLFAAAFIAWAIVRAYMPEITATEKPMEFAFLNGVLQSRHLPPIDPWLSGYAISYYYFGYIIIAMLTLLSGVASSVAFNLGIALLFALAATGAFGLAYDLIQMWREHLEAVDARPGRSIGFALIAPVLLLVVGNLEGAFEALHARGVGGPDFWNWLDVKGLVDAPLTGRLVPADNWWWWRASRVIHDVVQGQTQEVIDEFPQFSFLLGDMHPHVLALPFALLAMAAALNVLRGKGILNWRISLAGRVWNTVDPLLALIVGALGFLNAWDMPTYAFLVVASYAVLRLGQVGHWDIGLTREIVLAAIVLAAAALVLYLPFYVGFQSQAGGVLPVLFVKTRLHQYLIIFGFFLFVLGAFIAHQWRRLHEVSLRQWMELAKPFAVGAVLFPILGAGLAVVILGLSPAMRDSASAILANSVSPWLVNGLSAYFGPLIADPWLYLLLAVLLVTILALLRYQVTHGGKMESATAFVLIATFTGVLLTFGVEFVYLRDSFGTRMNSVFKFYFQAWTLFSVAATFAIAYLSKMLKGVARAGWVIGLLVFFAASLIYPLEAIPNRAEDGRKSATLDGTQWIKDYSPGDYAAIQWLNGNAAQGSTIVEATGGEYSYGNRISMSTGLPTVLGWAGHELQWRGNSRLFKDDAQGIDRAADIALLFQTVDPTEALTLVDKYAINFVVVGQTERSQYGLTKAQVDKFNLILNLVFESGDVRIYGRAG